MLQKNSDITLKKNTIKMQPIQDNEKVGTSYTDKNSKIVTKYEIEEYFDIKCAPVIDNCYHFIKSESELAANGILANEHYSSFFDFHEFIRNNVDLTNFYKKQLDS